MVKRQQRVTANRPPAPHVLAVDVGTSSVRAVVYDRAGHPVPGAQSQVAYQMDLTPDGGASADADRMVQRVADSIDGALANTSPPVEPAAVAMCTFWHNVLGVDSNDHPVTPVISWADTRPRSTLDELRRQIDPTAVARRTGCPLHSSYLPAKLLWLRRRDPASFGRAVRWMSIGEYLLFRFVGQRACSISMASGSGLLNQREDAWDEEVLERVEISADQLSPLVCMGTGFDTLRTEWKTRWPALARATWYPALGDGACSNIGAGCTTPDRAAVMVGTSGAMRVMLPHGTSREVPRGLWHYRADRRRALVGGALSNGGNVFGWLRGALQLPDRAVVEAELRQRLAQPHGLTVLP
ncbi:MAG: gluconokinase, partial [Pirellulales bacterium]